VLPPKSKAKHHDHVLQTTMSKVQSNSNAGTDHPPAGRALTSEHSNAVLAITFISAWSRWPIR
jgi:hypothetical protein